LSASDKNQKTKQQPTARPATPALAGFATIELTLFPKTS